jgi:hypothetical protein
VVLQFQEIRTEDTVLFTGVCEYTKTNIPEKGECDQHDQQGTSKHFHKTKVGY